MKKTNSRRYDSVEWLVCFALLKFSAVVAALGLLVMAIDWGFDRLVGK